MSKKTILIAGPTASGKSKLAMTLARAHNGVVINADSMQVYRELRVLTARPSVADEAACAHKLYGYVGLSQPYSVARWLEDVGLEIENVRVNDQLPIIVGGTGLYFMALTKGLAPVPTIDDKVREAWRNESQERSREELHDMLRERDPDMARRLRASDRQRVTRALEVVDGTGRSLSFWQEQRHAPLMPEGEFVGIVLERDRAELYRACDERMETMVELGALDELRVVYDMQLDRALPGMRALGVSPLLRFIDGEITLDAALYEAKRDTRRYAKRQLTWLRRNMIAWKHVNMKYIESFGGNSFPFIDS